MIKYDLATKSYKFFTTKATFLSYNKPVLKYTDDKKYFEELVTRWSHHSNLSFSPVVPTPEQESRLEEINTFEGKESWEPELTAYVEFGSVDPNTTYSYLADKLSDPLVTEANLNRVKQELRSALAAHRYEKEISGIKLEGGDEIATDRPSQAMLSGAFQALSQPFVTTIDWKLEGSWATVDLATIKPMVEACTKHVQKCFSTERAVENEINTTTDLATLESYDVVTAFNTKYDSTVVS